LEEATTKFWRESRRFTPEYEAEVLRSQALKRLITSDEVANLALFLASDASAAITNQSFVIDAGWT
jgi:enoyl-[acyl-carrier-protein] reductase (NADH)